MSMPDKRDAERWAYLTDGLGAGKAERESWTCMTIGLLAAIVAAAVVAYLSDQGTLPLLMRTALGVSAFFIVLLFASRECKRRSGMGGDAPAKPAPAPTARTAAAPAAAPTPAPSPAPAPAPEPAAEDVGTRPEALSAARDGKPDDLKKIKGVGPKLEQLCNRLGFYHYDQIANWSADEVAWVDANLEGFKGRVTRDDWVSQAKILASGGSTEFSSRQ